MCIIEKRWNWGCLNLSRGHSKKAREINDFGFPRFNFIRTLNLYQVLKMCKCGVGMLCASPPQKQLTPWLFA